jgi:methylmalonyl-CoA/ethylmalonyl-CoA epimerase
MFTRIDHIAVIVPNLDEAIQYYCSSFGLSISLREKNEKEGFEVVAFKVGDASFELLAPFRPDSVISNMLEKRGPGIHHIGLEVSSVKESMAALLQKGLRFTSDDPKTGSEGSIINFIHPKSLYGTMLELVEHPLSHHKPDKGLEINEVNDC